MSINEKDMEELKRRCEGIVNVITDNSDLLKDIGDKLKLEFFNDFIFNLMKREEVKIFLTDKGKEYLNTEAEYVRLSSTSCRGFTYMPAENQLAMDIRINGRGGWRYLDKEYWVGIVFIDEKTGVAIDLFQTFLSYYSGAINSYCVASTAIANMKTIPDALSENKPETKTEGNVTFVEFGKKKN